MRTVGGQENERMRLRVFCGLEREIAVPVNHQHLLTGLVYGLLGASDAEYARFLHDEGYGVEGEERRFKLFVFSPLRARRRCVARPVLRLGSGEVIWFIASPVEAFLRHCATGLLAAGALTVGRERLPIRTVESLPDPEFRECAAFTCLSPVVAGVRRPDGSVRYLRPGDAEEFSEAVRRNALRKYQVIHGEPPADDRLHLTFDAEYLARSPHGGTKNIEFKGIHVIGVQAPLTLEGSPELIRTAWECGLGEKNAQGFGMLDLDSPRNSTSPRSHGVGNRFEQFNRRDAEHAEVTRRDRECGDR